jgi:hypothetical protein
MTPQEITQFREIVARNIAAGAIKVSKNDTTEMYRQKRRKLELERYHKKADERSRLGLRRDNGKPRMLKRWGLHIKDGIRPTARRGGRLGRRWGLFKKGNL